jgi:hypothetical protein
MELLKLNVGGVIYMTLSDTVLPISSKIDKDTNFIDRNGILFEHVLEFLRNGDRTILPDDLITCRKVVLEAQFFSLSSFQAMLERQIYILDRPKYKIIENNATIALKDGMNFDFMKHFMKINAGLFKYLFEFFPRYALCYRDPSEFYVSEIKQFHKDWSQAMKGAISKVQLADHFKYLCYYATEIQDIEILKNSSLVNFCSGLSTMVFVLDGPPVNYSISYRNTTLLKSFNNVCCASFLNPKAIEWNRRRFEEFYIENHLLNLGKFEMLNIVFESPLTQDSRLHMLGFTIMQDQVPNGLRHPVYAEEDLKILSTQYKND